MEGFDIHEEDLLAEEEKPRVYKEKGELAYFTNMSFIAERMRVAPTVRLAHLEKLHKSSPDTERLLELVIPVEKYIDGVLAALIEPHPTWPWAKRSKGIGKENFPKCVGRIEKFGKYYPPGDPKIPPYVTRPLETYWELDRKGNVVEKQGIWVEGIERLSLPSKLWKLSGQSVKDGHAARRERGVKLSFDSVLRMAFHRLNISLMRAGGIWYSGGDSEQGYSRGYQGHKKVIIDKKTVEGYKIIPTPKERECPNCGPVDVKVGKYCPNCGETLSLKKEGPGILYTGHVHNMALRLMGKDFQLCLWRVWREALGLPVADSYGEARHGHVRIDPWKMVDR